MHFQFLSTLSYRYLEIFFLKNQKVVGKYYNLFKDFVSLHKWQNGVG